MEERGGKGVVLTEGPYHTSGEIEVPPSIYKYVQTELCLETALCVDELFDYILRLVIVTVIDIV